MKQRAIRTVGKCLLGALTDSVVVEPKAFPNLNVAGATALQEYLVSAAAQARVRGFRYPGTSLQLWWPGGQHN